MFSFKEAKDQLDYLEPGLHIVRVVNAEGFNSDPETNKTGYITVNFESETGKTIGRRWYTAAATTTDTKKIANANKNVINRCFHVLKQFIKEDQAKAIEARDFIDLAKILNKYINPKLQLRLKVIGEKGQDGKVYSGIGFPPFLEPLTENKLVFDPNDPKDNPVPDLATAQAAATQIETKKEDLPF